jgi:hypothetical protein
MGGLGSGGWNASGRTTVEATARLAIAALQKRGGLRPGAYLIWRWSRGDETFASIGVHGERGGVRLTYHVGADGGSARRVDEHVALKHHPCRFGGERAFFCCPRCARDVLNLHLAGGRFMCRECGRLTYSSRRERGRDRNLRAANKLRQRLGGEIGALNSVAARPKGMWRRTYDRLIADIERREGQAFEELAGWMLKLDGARKQRAAEFWK